MKQPSDEPQKRDNDGLHKRRGRWYYCLIIAGERRFFSTKSTNYQEARRVRAKAIKDQEDGRLPNDLSKLPFEKLLDMVMKEREPLLSEGSKRIDRERSRPLLKAFTGRRVSTIDIKVIRDYQTSRKVGNRTINLEVKLLRAVLKSAKTWASLADDYKPLPEDRRGPGRAIEEHQEKILLDTARSRPEWDAAFLAAMASTNTTMRGCELKGLRLQNVDLLKQEISIQKSKGKKAGIRNIPMNGTAVWAFARLLERAAALGSRAPEHFLLPRFKYRSKKANRGTGYDPTQPQKTWRTAWRALVRETGRRAGREAAKQSVEAGNGWRAGIAAWRGAAASFRGLRFHDLRHLAVTKLAESEASDATIMAIAGHMSREMMEHYSHVRAAAKRKAVDAIRSYVPEESPAAINSSKAPARVQ
jgi:integrase